MAVIKCPSCGAETSSYSTQCSACGAEYKYCPQCGNVMLGQKNFCSKCGHPFKSAAKENNNQPSNGLGTQNSVAPTVAVQAKGKKFAIPAFVLAMVTVFFVFFAIGWQMEIKHQQELLHQMSNSQVYYYIENLDELYAAFKAFCVISIIAAVVSDVLVVFAYIGHSKNVRNGVRAKLVLVFAIIATVLANIFGVIAIVLFQTV